MIVPIATTDLVLDASPLDYAEANRAAIKAYWRRLMVGKDRLWNGPFFLFNHVALTDGHLSGRAHRTDYATFLHWRDHGRPAPNIHLTGTSMPVTADGVLIAVRMAAHTVNAGQVYFPAGSLDECDLVGGRFDVTGNIRRELAEETGLKPPLAAFEAGFAACRLHSAWFLARRCRLELTFEACQRRFAAHQAETGDDEASELLAISGPDDAEGLSPYARALALWHFGGDSQGD